MPLSVDVTSIGLASGSTACSTTHLRTLFRTCNADGPPRFAGNVADSCAGADRSAIKALAPRDEPDLNPVRVAWSVAIAAKVSAELHSPTSRVSRTQQHARVRADLSV